MRSFTLIEVLIVIGIIIILAILAFPAYRFFQRESDLTNSSVEIANTIRLAQNKTLVSEGASQYGVYFDQTTAQHQYILFKGVSYGGRDASFDEIHKLSSFVEISEINLAGGVSEVVFNRVSGETSQFGNISLRLKIDPAKIETIYIENSGLVDFVLPSTPSDVERVKDSRHVHFTHNQDVRNAVTLHLIFPNYPADNFDINFQNYLDSGKTEFYWEGGVLVGQPGNQTEQKLIIQTHFLDITSAQFSVHRDRRYNDKALEIILDDQNLIYYTTDGQTTKGSSVHVTDPQWQ